jgi:hypothetical protein
MCQNRLQRATVAIRGVQNEACNWPALLSYCIGWILLVNLSDVDRAVWDSIFTVVRCYLHRRSSLAHWCDSLVDIKQRMDTLVSYHRKHPSQFLLRSSGNCADTTRQIRPDSTTHRGSSSSLADSRRERASRHHRSSVATTVKDSGFD